MNNTIITVTGPTCSGKSTLTRMLVDTGKFTEIVSTTTRPQRVGEVNGEHYHFVSLEEFDKLDMLERITFNGNTYGGSVAEFEEKFASGLVPVIVVEPNGMFQVNRNAAERGWRVINVFVNCPPEVQAKRFLTRFTEDYRKILGQGDFDDYMDLMTEYSDRMASILTTESQWSSEYHRGKTDEWFEILEFDATTERVMVDTIIKMV